MVPVPQTDTGRQGEYPQALERTLCTRGLCAVRKYRSSGRQRNGAKGDPTRDKTAKEFCRRLRIGMD